MRSGAERLIAGADIDLLVRGGRNVEFRIGLGFGRHGLLEDHFFELSGRLPVVVEFLATEEEVDRFLTFVQAEEATLFYAKMPVEFGWIKGPSACTSSEGGEKTLEQMREEIRNAQLVSCDQPEAYIFGLTMAAWNAIFAMSLTIGTILVWKFTPRLYPKP